MTMTGHWWTNDRFLAYGGIVVAVAAFVMHVVAAANPHTGDWLTFIGDYAVGVIVVAWLVVGTVRHVRGHRHGRGGRWVVAAWVLVGLFYGFALLQALDPANDAAVLGKLPTVRDLISMAGLWVPIPLVLVSVGLLRDVAEPSSAPRRGAQPTT